MIHSLYMNALYVKHLQYDPDTNYDITPTIIFSLL